MDPLKLKNNIMVMQGSEFAKIITGDASVVNMSQYIYTSGRAEMIDRMQRSDAIKNGKEPPKLYPISISPPDVRFEPTKSQRFGGVPQEYFPDLKKPIIYEIEGYVSIGRMPSLGVPDMPPLTRGIRIIDCDFTNEVFIHYIESNFELHFIKSKFNASLRLASSHFKQILIEGCTVTQEISLIHCETEELSIRNTQAEKIKIKLKDTVPSKIEISDLTCETLEIESELELKEVSIKNLCCKKLCLNAPIANLTIARDKENEAYVEELEYELLEKVDKSKIYINTNGLGIGKFKLKGVLSGGKVIIKHSDFNELYLEDFTNTAMFKINNATINKSLVIAESSLSKAEMNNVNLLCINKVQVYQSNISEMSLFNTVIPKNLISKDNQDYVGLREVYCQLKGIAARQKNKVDELHYQQLEFDAYEKVLKKEKTGNDRFILCTNKYSNNHGQDWLRALVWLIGCSLAFFLIIKGLLGYTTFNLNLFPKDTASFLNFMLNPLHKFDEIFGEIKSETFNKGLALLVDVFAKFISGYLIFQFLRAFRKYSQ